MSTTEAPSQVYECWLACQIVKGMFSNEVVVVYPPDSQNGYSQFVPKSTVEGEIGTTGRVRVRVIRDDDATLVVLPSAERDVISVRPDDLSPIEQ